MLLESGGGGGAPKDREPPRRHPGTPSPGSALIGGGPAHTSEPDHGPVTKLTPYSVAVPAKTVEVPSPVTENYKGYSSETGYPQAGSLPFSMMVTPPETTTKEIPAETKTYKTRRTVELTAEDYQNLTDKQRAAVDFNTLLVGAREKDLTTDYNATPQQKAIYEQAVENMFGKDGGTDTFAPETLAVLEQIDFKTKEQDFDDFLGLKVAITEKDLADFEIPAPASVAAPASPVDQFIAPPAVELQDTLIEHTQALQEKMSQTYELIQNFQKAAAMARNEDLQFYGGVPNTSNLASVFDNKADSYFQKAYETLADANLGAAPGTVAPDPKMILGFVQHDLEAQGLKKDDFLRYVDERTKYAADYGVQLGQRKNVQYRSPEEFRQLLGLDESGA